MILFKRRIWLEVDLIHVIAFELMFVIMFSQEEIRLFHGDVSLLSNLLDELDDQEMFTSNYKLISIGA